MSRISLHPVDHRFFVRHQFYIWPAWMNMWLREDLWHNCRAPTVYSVLWSVWTCTSCYHYAYNVYWTVFWNWLVTHISHVVFLFLHPVSFMIALILGFCHSFSLPVYLSFSPLMHAVRFFSLIHQYTIVQRLPFSDANYLPKWECEALCLPAQSFIDRSVS